MIFEPLVQTKFALIINGFLSEPFLKRFISFAQEFIFVALENSRPNNPVFVQNSFNLSLLNSIPANTVVLSMKYSIKNPIEHLSYEIEDFSNDGVESSFYLKNSQISQTLYLVTKASPLKLSSPQVTFWIRIKNNLLSGFSRAQINLNVLSFVSDQLTFLAPSSPNEIINLDFGDLRNNSIVYELKATSMLYQADIFYQILNTNYSKQFYVDGSYIRIKYPNAKTMLSEDNLVKKLLNKILNKL